MKHSDPNTEPLQPRAVIIGLGSSIGGYVGCRLQQDGWSVTGSARSGTVVDSRFTSISRCNLDDAQSIERAKSDLRESAKGWSLLLFAAGSMLPIGRFFGVDEVEWERGLQVSALGPLRLLRAVWPVRSLTSTPTVCFLAGGGTNNDFPNYSAYCLAKILLIKFVELIQSEEPSARFVIIGPGYVRTAIHDETLAAGEAAGKNHERTVQLLTGPGTDLELIYQHVVACHLAPAEVFGGRNYSTVHDDWKGELVMQTIADYPRDAYRLRRFPFEPER